jgi:tRNA U38,U39,U40 pseudouridine synthase TruA
MRGETTVRDVFGAEWRQFTNEAVRWWGGHPGDGVVAQDGTWFIFDITGNAFLRGMVRRLVSAMLRVGTGTWSVDQMAVVLASRNLALAAPPAPACGLCLMEVEYA